MSTPDIFYKYVNVQAATSIIDNCTLRFGRPSEMNDPFDLYITDLFEHDFKKQQKLIVRQVFDDLRHRPDFVARLTGTDLVEVHEIRKLILDSPEDKLDHIIHMFNDIIDTEASPFDPPKELEDQRQQTIHYFKNSAIFCASARNNNLLMWSHYADQHRGVVLGFKPDQVRDSFLTALEPVIYSAERPRFYKPIEALHDEDSTLTPEVLASVRQKLALSKSLEWSYEEEYRVFIPGYFSHGENEKFLQFYSEELVEIYFGCRATQQTKDFLSTIALRLNANVRLFEAVLDKTSYLLNFKELS